MQVFETVTGFLVNAISHFSNKEIAFEAAYAILGASVLLWGVLVAWPHHRFATAIRRGVKKAKDVAATNGMNPEDRLAALDADLKGNPILADSWRPYREALRPYPQKEGLFTNTVDPYAWFAPERLPGRGYEKWASTLAGVSLTVGLLFTFVGLSAALFKVGDASTNTEMLRKAIGEILNISSAKFITSMAGIVAYIGWTVLARFYFKFASAVQRLSVMTTPEVLLLDQLAATNNQTDRLKRLFDDLTVAFDSSLTKVLAERLDSLPTAVGDVLRPTLESTVRPVVAAIADMGGTIGAGNHAALEGMIAGLMTEIRGSAGREMEGLAQAMRETADELRSARSGIGAEGAEFGRTLTQAAEDMSASAKRLADTFESRLNEMDATLASGAQRLDQMGGSMSAAMEEGLRQAVDGIASAAREAAQAARGQAQAELAPLLAELKLLVGEIRASAEDSRGALVAGGQEAAGQLQSALSVVSEHLAQASSRASEEIVGAYQEATASVLQTVESSVAGYTAATDALASRLQTVERGFATLEGSIQRSTGRLDETGGAMATAGRTIGAATDQLRAAAAPVVSALQAVEGAASNTQASTRALVEAGETIRAAIDALGGAAQSAGDAFKAYDDRFAGVDESLGRTVETLRNGIHTLGTPVTQVVSEYDRHFASAIEKLRGAIGELSEAVQDISPQVVMEGA